MSQLEYLKYPKNSYEREALEVQISEFGQIPLQLFDAPHPTKKARMISLQKLPKEYLKGYELCKESKYYIDIY